MQLSVVAVAACGNAPVRGSGGGELVNVSRPRTSCPPAEDVWLATYTTETDRNVHSTKNHGWFMPIGLEILDEPSNPGDPAAVAEKAMTAAEEARWMPPHG